MTDDSEEIFRRAAKNYPLKTDSQDWEIVFKKMQRTSGAGGEHEPQEKKRGSGWLLLLLILIPIAVIEHNYKQEANEIRQAAATKRSHDAAVSVDNTTANKKHTNDKPADEPVTNNTAAVTVNKTTTTNDPVQNVSDNKIAGTLADKPTLVMNPPAANETKSTPVPAAKNKDGKHAAVQSAQAVLSSLTTGDDNLPKRTVGKNRSIQQGDNTSTNIENGITGHKKKKFVSKQKTRVNIINAEATGDGNTAIASTGIIKTVPDVQNPVAIQPVEDTSSVAANVTADPAKIPGTEITITALVDSNSATAKTRDKKEQKKKQKQKHWYAGLVAGPDFSSIKLQSVKKTGLNFGLVAGYKFNNKLSIETGFLRDKKLYSSQGKYFSRKNIRVYPNSTIEYVKGECNMYELPLNLNYTFSIQKRSAWFGAAGVSAYFMRKEAYVFNMRHNNNMYPYAADYKNHDKQFLAVINLSAGYVHHFGSILDLRIQPYLKIPVNKVGTGELPIQSAGVLVGITKDIF